MQPVTADVILNWSAEQDKIFAWFAGDQQFFLPFFGTREYVNVDNHLVVTAYAGTGKSTTILEGVKRAPKGLKILIAAFSKLIEQAMLQKIGPGYPHITVKTLHALGLRCITRYRRVNIEERNASTRADSLTDKVCGLTAPDAITKLVTKLHTKGREIAPHATKVGDLSAIAITFD